MSVPGFTHGNDARGPQSAETTGGTPEPGFTSHLPSPELKRECFGGHPLPHPAATHCLRCHASWTRTSNTAHCMSCHRTFSTPGVFDRHLQRVGCANPVTITSRDGRARFDPTPRPNRWGTPVWHLAGRRPPAEDQ